MTNQLRERPATSSPSHSRMLRSLLAMALILGVPLSSAAQADDLEPEYIAVSPDPIAEIERWLWEIEDADLTADPYLRIFYVAADPYALDEEENPIDYYEIIIFSNGDPVEILLDLRAGDADAAESGEIKREKKIIIISN